jgi:hypothetical protein
VFLLGAGFSKAISDCMPLMPALGERVRNLLCDGVLPAPVDKFGEDFEAWLSYLAVDQPWLSAADNLRNRAAFLDVSRAVEEVMSAAEQQATQGRSLPTPLARLVRYWVRENVTVVTFNYDLLVESAYLGASWADRNPDVEHLYRVPLTTASARPGKGFILGNEPLRAFDLLKLHGSMNWYYSGVDDAAADTIYLGRTPRRWSEPVSGDPIYPDELVVETPRDPDYLADKVPMIVPPASVKSGFYSNLSLRTQWRAAAKALTDADELVVIGYSLPKTDELVQSLLVTKSSAVQRIVSVDKDIVAAERLRKMFGADRVDGPFTGDGALSNYVSALPNE